MLGRLDVRICLTERVTFERRSEEGKGVSKYLGGWGEISSRFEVPDVELGWNTHYQQGSQGPGAKWVSG